jgi:hypothetical protein
VRRLTSGGSQHKAPDERLIHAVGSNLVAEVQRPLAQKASANAERVKGCEGRPALFHAETFGRLEIAGMLCDEGTNVNFGADEGAAARSRRP